MLAAMGVYVGSNDLAFVPWGRPKVSCGSSQSAIAGAGKTPISRQFWEGHEFHSCRNCREINRGFQPLEECCTGKTLFPQL